MKEALGAPFKALKVGADLTLKPPFEATKRAINPEMGEALWWYLCSFVYRVTGSPQTIMYLTSMKDGFVDGLTTT